MRTEEKRRALASLFRELPEILTPIQIVGTEDLRYDAPDVLVPV